MKQLDSTALDDAGSSTADVKQHYYAKQGSINLIEEQIKLYADKSDKIRHDLLQEALVLVKQLFLQNHPGSEISNADIDTWTAVLKERDFCVECLDGLDPVTLSGLYNICKTHLDNNEAPKRIHYPKPGRDDENVRQAIDRETALIEMTFKHLGIDAVDGGLIKRDEVTGHYVPLTRGELKNTELHVMDKTMCAVSPERARKLLLHNAERNVIHPLAEELNKCAEEYQGTDEEAKELVDNIPKLLFNNDFPIANQAFKQTLFTQADLAMGNPQAVCNLFVSILAGEQGTYKSSAWKTLATLNLPHLENCYSVCSSTAQQLTQDVTLRSPAAWMELAEIERYLTSSNLDSFKNLVTDTHPLGRRPYDPAPTRFRRMSVWVGSTNHPMSILVDRSSSYDRRLVPIQVPSGSFIDIDQLNDRVREIWGAVLHLYKKGYCPNPSSLHPSCYEVLAEYQSQFQEVSPVEQDLLDYAKGMNVVNPSDAVPRALGIEHVDVTASQIKDARNVYKNHLAEAGFVPDRIRVDGRRLSVFVRTSETEMSPRQLLAMQDEINRGRSRHIDFPPVFDSDGKRLRQEDF